MSNKFISEASRDAAVAPALLHSREDALSAQPLSRLVTRDERKPHQTQLADEDAQALDDSFRPDKYKITTDGKRAVATAYAQPFRQAIDGIGFIDALSFTLDIQQSGIEWLQFELRKVFGIQQFEPRSGGIAGYANRLAIGTNKSVLAWGGEMQRGTAYVSFMGAECSRFKDWKRIADWCEENKVKLTRIDLAHDDLDGNSWTMERVTQCYLQGGFKTGGCNPKHEMYGPWIDPSQGGRTFYVGKGENGKLFRAYEKGKKEGYGSDKWIRLEIQYGKKGRVLEYDMLRFPGQYLAGAYPCLRELSEKQSRIRTIKRGALTSLKKSVAVAKTQYGKLVNVLLQVTGGDYQEVVAKLIRSGVPARLDPYSYHLHTDPTLADWIGGQLDAALVT
jgi:phage replication initiation protein